MTKSKFFILFLAMLVLVPIAVAAPPDNPTVATRDAKGVGTTNATLEGILVTLGASNLNAWVNFSYGQTAAYGSVSSISLVSTNATNFSIGVSGLTPGKVYHYRAYANTSQSNSTYDGVGNDYTLMTKPAAMSGLNAVAKNKQVDLSWTLGTGGIGCYIEYSTTVIAVWSVGDGTSIGNINGTVYSHTSLNSNTKYYYKLWCYAYNESVRSNGSSTHPYADSPGTTDATTPSDGTPGGSGATGSNVVIIIVKDKDGKPLRGITVTFSGRTAVTDSAGGVTFPETADGTHTILISEPGYESYSQTVTVTDSVTLQAPLMQLGAEPNGVPGFEILVFFVAALFSALLLYRKKKT